MTYDFSSDVQSSPKLQEFSRDVIDPDFDQNIPIRSFQCEFFDEKQASAMQTGLLFDIF